MKSILRGRRLITLMLLLFLTGMIVLVVRIQLEASFYISQSGKPCYGMVYDREGDVLFDGINGYEGYESGHFADVGSLIGDTLSTGPIPRNPTTRFQRKCILTTGPLQRPVS